MNFNGGQSDLVIPDNLITTDINASSNLGVLGKYRFPTDPPTAPNQVILATNSTGSQGEKLCVWGTEGAGDVVGPVSSLANEVVVYGDLTGKVLTNSNLLYTDISTNPLNNSDNDATPPNFQFQKSRAGAGVLSGDVLGNVSYNGFQTTSNNYETGGEIKVEASEDWSASNGCNMVFMTTANGQTTPTEAVIITSEKETLVNGPVRVADGSVGVPSVSFISDDNTGLYKVSTDALGVSNNGSKTAEFNTTKLSLENNLEVKNSLFVGNETSPTSSALMTVDGTTSSKIVLRNRAGTEGAQVQFLSQPSNINWKLNNNYTTNELETLYDLGAGKNLVNSFWQYGQKLRHNTILAQVSPILALERARGSGTTYGNVLNGDILGRIDFDGYVNGAFQIGGNVEVVANEDWTGSTRGSQMIISTNDAGGILNSPKITIDQSGTVVSNKLSVPQIVIEGSTFNWTIDDEGAGALLNFTKSNDNAKMTFAGSSYTVYRGSNDNAPIGFDGFKSRGTVSTPTALLNNDTIKSSRAYGHNGTGFVVGSDISTITTQNWSLGNNGSKMILKTTNLGASVATEKLSLQDGGITVSDSIKIKNGGVVEVSLNSDQDGYLELKNGAGENIAYIGRFNYRKANLDDPQGLGDVILRGRGTQSTPTAVLNDDRIEEYYYNAHDGTDYWPGAYVETKTTQNWSAGNRGTEYKIQTCDNGTTVLKTKLLLNSSGVSLNDGTDSYVMPTTRPTTGQFLYATNSAGVLGWSSGPDHTNSYFQRYWTGNTTPVSMGALGAFYLINGSTYTDGPTAGWTHSATASTYVGGETRLFKLTANVAWKNNGVTPQTFMITFLLNGVVQNAGKMRTILDDAASDYPRNTTSEMFLTLTNNDTIGPVVSCLTSTDACIVQDINFNVVQIA